MRNAGVNGKGGDGRRWLGTLAAVHASATAASLLQCHLMFAVKYLQIRCHGNWGASELLSQFCFLKCISLPASIEFPGNWPGSESYSQSWDVGTISASHFGGQQPDPHSPLAHRAVRQFVLGPNTQNPPAFTTQILSLSGSVASIPSLRNHSEHP